MNNLITILLAALLFVACDKDKPVIPEDTYWTLESPAAHGFDPDSLDVALSNARTLSNFKALLVVRNNKLVVEEYYNGANVNSLLHLRSVTKNFTSALTGIAIAENILDSLNSTLEEYIPDLTTGDKEQLTIRHLLNMASGLEWNEDTEVIPLIERQIPNPVETILSRDLVGEPGVDFNYNSVLAHVVSFIISEQTNKSYDDFMEEKIFAPLDIGNYAWDRDPEGKVWGGFGLQLTARGLAKFGQLYLNNGKLNGEQIVPEEWIAISRNAQIQVPGTTAGYSLQWWISGSTQNLFYGQGYGGQGLMLIPEKDLMIVCFHEYFVSAQQSSQQWADFVNKVFRPIYNAAD